MTSFLTQLSATQLRKAAAIREKIEKLENELARLLRITSGTPSSRPSAVTISRGRRHMSAAARAKIAAAAKARWKKAKAAGKSHL